MYRCVVITDDKTVILCIRIINILLKLSEWVNCLPSVGHRRICSCHRELCINSVTSPFLGTRGLDGSMRGGQFRCPPPPNCLLREAGVVWPVGTPPQQAWCDFPPKHLLRDLLNISWKPIISLPGYGRWSLFSDLYLGPLLSCSGLLLLLTSTASLHSVLSPSCSACSWQNACVPPYNGMARQGIASLACAKGIKGAACVTCGGKK